jgi:microcystin-dependent protein
MTGPRLLGRDNADTGAVEEIPIGAGLAFSGNTLISTIASIPIGCIIDFAGATAPPTKWLFCYGQEVSRTTYSALYAVLGTTYGDGNGSNTFNLPDLRGRVRAGRDNMGGSPADRLTNTVDGTQMGHTGGHERITLESDHLPSHTHTGTTTSSGSHTHFEFSVAATVDSSPSLLADDPPAVRNDSSGNLSYGIQGDVATEAVATLGKTSANGNHTHTFTTSAAGGDDGHINLQPTMILNAIIYAGV